MTTLAIGQPAPHFTVPSTTDQPFQLSDYLLMHEVHKRYSKYLYRKSPQAMAQAYCFVFVLCYFVYIHTPYLLHIRALH